MIKDAKFPVIKTTDLRLYKETFKFTPKGKIDVTKAKIDQLVIKPKREVSMKLGNGKLKEVDLRLKKAGTNPVKIKEVKDKFKGSLGY